ncbi:NAD(P)-dependent oxidoreductase [Pseudoroseicyclus sp. CLL3-39]|uniref:NAD(P)-dependent oxidoreductase n=1 Tax=Pseudoroseicyclus tamaricis TaxID=2705421 RepID=A0A6B2K2M2_9RHOB|nr:NAD(P)-dependent oxidoreductase [Pseudoroseicyclus tamaricis]
MRIGFLGFGEAGEAFARSLAGRAEMRATDLRAERMAAAEAAGVEAVAPEGLAEADWLISAVTADASLTALEGQAEHLRPGQLVIDINSVSPVRKRASRALAEGRGASYLDMAVMAPVHPRGHATPVLVAGPAPEAELTELGFDWRSVGAEPGQATAIKMVRSLFVKGLEAITVETLLAAEASGCAEEILASLGKSYPGLGFPGLADYQFERTLVHGARRAAEMRESAATIDELGLTGALAAAIAEVQERQARAQVASDAPLADRLAARLKP